jgi:hypothetical protein
MGGLELTYGFGLHGLDEGLGGDGAAVILEPGAIAEDADGRVCESVSDVFLFMLE